MRVRTRLLLLGAVTPLAALVLVAGLAGLILQRRLEARVDAHLLAQAAVESVGMFDGPDGTPHLHAHESPLAADLREVVPDGAIYAAGGERITVTREGARVPERMTWDRALGVVTVRDGDHGTGAVRELIAAVAAPSGSRYTLYLAVPRGQVARTMRGYWLGAAVALATVGALLLAVQLIAARRLAARIGALRAYLPRLREGQAEPAPPPDPTGDELAALRDGLYAAARQLEEQRAREERGLASAAHDLRTPLGVMRTTIDLALRRPRDVAELRDALAEVRAEVDRMRGLADAILHARRGERQREPLDLAELLDSAVRTLAPAAAAAGVTLAATRATAPVAGDPVALRRVLDNLIHNALAHAPRGSVVDVALGSDGTRQRLVVRDRGSGIPPERREDVFHPGTRGPESSGAGLGLAIVRQIVTEHGGEVWVGDATPGAELIVELPAVQAGG